MKVICPRCSGTKEYETVQDMHRSAGIIPCYDCDENGMVEQAELDRRKKAWDDALVQLRQYGNNS